MGGSTGAALDTTLSLGRTLYDPEKGGIKKSAEGLQQSMMEQHFNFTKRQ